jgi:hypothetical protein
MVSLAWSNLGILTAGGAEIKRRRPPGDPTDPDLRSEIHNRSAGGQEFQERIKKNLLTS